MSGPVCSELVDSGIKWERSELGVILKISVAPGTVRWIGVVRRSCKGFITKHPRASSVAGTEPFGRGTTRGGGAE